LDRVTRGENLKMNNKCSICEREIKGMQHNWINSLVGIQDIVMICEECNLSVDEQLINLIEDFKK
jgi:hypothetical protein